MKKIIEKHDNKDRIICVTNIGKHEFYYQPFGTKDRFWLFDTKDFSRTIFAYFRDNGRNLNGRGFGLTIKELYEFKGYRNSELAKIMLRIPGQVEYVIRESYGCKENNELLTVDIKPVSSRHYYEDYAYAA